LAKKVSSLIFPEYIGALLQTPLAMMTAQRKN